MFSIIIIKWNTRDILYKCLKSLEKEKVDEIIVVDNASSDGSVEMLRKHFKNVILIINPINYGYAKAANIGIKNSMGDLILLLNSDIFIEKGTIKRIKLFMSNNPNVEIASPLLYSPEGEQIKTLRPIPNLIFMLLEYSFISHIFPFAKAILPKYIQGAALVIRRDIVEKIGLFDERFFFYSEDADFCFRARRHGLKMKIITTAKAIHLCGESSKKKSKSRYYVKNIAANLEFIDKYYAKVTTNFVKNLTTLHFFIKSIFLNILSISYIDKREIDKKLSLYNGIMNICRR